MSGSSIHTDFTTTNYYDFVSELRDRLGDHTTLKTNEFTIDYFQRNEGTQPPTHYHYSYSYDTEELPESDQELLSTIKAAYQQVLADPDLAAERVISLVLDKNTERECSHCTAYETTAHKLLRCTQCLTAFYCDTNCQRSHWETHKQFCRRVRPSTT